MFKSGIFQNRIKNMMFGRFRVNASSSGPVVQATTAHVPHIAGPHCIVAHSSVSDCLIPRLFYYRHLPTRLVRNLQGNAQRFSSDIGRFPVSRRLRHLHCIHLPVHLSSSGLLQRQTLSETFHYQWILCAAPGGCYGVFLVHSHRTF